MAPQSDKPVFVGIARTDQVTSYLSGVAHTTLTDLDYEPFEASYNRRAASASRLCPRTSDLGGFHPGAGARR